MGVGADAIGHESDADAAIEFWSAPSWSRTVKAQTSRTSNRPVRRIFQALRVYTHREGESMEADEVYSQLNDKISELKDKIGEFQGTIDYLNSTLTQQKSAIDKTQSDIDRINSALNDLKSGASNSKPDNSQQGLDDLRKKIEDANAAAEKRYQDQQGLLGKLAAQADDAAKTLINFPDTAKAIATKAWEDGKKEILGIWESSKNDILNSLSSVTTGLIKEAKTSIKDEIKDELKSLIFDDVKEVETAKPAPLTEQELEVKIKTIVQEALAAKQG